MFYFSFFCLVFGFLENKVNFLWWVWFIISWCLGLANLKLWLYGILGTDQQIGSSWWGTRKPWKNPICSQVVSTAEALSASNVEALGSPVCSSVNTFSERETAAAAKSLQSCPTVRPQRRQPTRLPRPWDSPGKNTGLGCHFLLQCMKVRSESEVAQLHLTCRDPMDCSLLGSSIHGIFQARVLEWGAIAFSRKGDSYAF